MIEIDWRNNKTAGYQAYIAPFHFYKRRLLKIWKRCIFEKSLLLHIFSFSHVQSFLTFCWKNLIIRAEMKFYQLKKKRNITIWYAFCIKFATFRDFEKFLVFWKNPSILSKKTQISNVLRNLTISVAFYSQFATIWSKNDFTFSSVNKLADVAWTQLANIGWKKNVANVPFEWKILLSYS